MQNEEKTTGQHIMGISNALGSAGCAIMMLPFYLIVMVVCGFLLWAMFSAWVITPVAEMF